MANFVAVRNLAHQLAGVAVPDRYFPLVWVEFRLAAEPYVARHRALAASAVRVRINNRATRGEATPGDGRQSVSGEAVNACQPGPDRLAERSVRAAPWDRFQMPAYHLCRGDTGHGVTIVNIGVGPSNAKRITDHLAVRRPHCWLMVGHCSGLRQSQVLGDYVLPHGYLRPDRILDDLVPPEVPIPALAEVQVAMQEAAAHQSLASDRSRYGEQDTGGPGLPLAGSRRHFALCLQQAVARRTQAAWHAAQPQAAQL